MQSVKGGKSNAFIFITEDKKFVIKTIRDDELRLLLTILPEYEIRVMESNTYLVKIFGVFRIYPGQMSVIIMENLFPQRKNMIIFDIKGGLASRNVDFNGFPAAGETLKDRNFMEMGIKIQTPDKDEIIKCLEKDFGFLERCEIMDYSLVVGIPIHELRESSIIKMSNSSVIGVIDILQKYNLKKKSENLFKSMLTDPENFSAIDPILYSSRIRNFLRGIFIK